MVAVVHGVDGRVGGDSKRAVLDVAVEVEPVHGGGWNCAEK
jgi:hypothetical protein